MDFSPADQTLVRAAKPVGCRRSYARIPEILPIPDLTRVQIDSFRWLREEGLREIFSEISPIVDFAGKAFELHFLDHSFGEPKHDPTTCRERGLTYAAPLRVRARLIAKETGEIKEQEIFIGDFPLMTETGSFVVNGTERVVVNQLVRSP